MLTRIAFVAAASLNLACLPVVGLGSTPDPGSIHLTGRTLAQLQQPAQDASAVAQPATTVTPASATVTETPETSPVKSLDEQGVPAEDVAETDQALEPSADGTATEVHEEAIGPVGDDEMPTERQQQNNPYAAPLSPDSVYEAYVPPTETEEEAKTKSATEQGNELINILGAEVFNRRVNISTPPDTEVAEVIRLLSERANLNFIYGEGVITGRVTLNLKDVPLGVALQSLLATHALTMIREGENVMRIAPMQEVEPGEVETRTISIRLNWVTANSILPAIQGLKKRGPGNIKVHKESNTLVICDTPPNLAVLRDIIQQLDVPEKQVMIEARMAELLINNGRALGSQLRMETDDSHNNSGLLGTLSNNGPHTQVDRTVTIDPATGKPTVTSVQTAVAARAVDGLVSNLLVGGGAPRVDFGGVVSIFGREFDVAAALDGLENRNMANILANPRVITLNNQEAFIDIKREIPYLEAQQGVSQNAVSATVKFKDAGVSLRVLPVITNNGFVRMKLEPTQLIRAGTFTSPQGEVPIIDRREAITNVIVKDEDTVVLGGLREVSSADAKSQYPWLGQAPVVGWFFKRDNRSHLKNDLMLFVTPHIIKAPVLSPAEQYKHSRIDAHWDLPDFFFDDSVEARESRHRGEADNTASSYVNQTLKLPALATPPAPAQPASPADMQPPTLQAPPEETAPSMN